MCHAGDPTDTSIKLRPLEPASGQALARDLVLKTRRRKGLGDQISVSKYLDDEFIVSGINGRLRECSPSADDDLTCSSRCLRLDTRICWARRVLGACGVVYGLVAAMRACM